MKLNQDEIDHYKCNGYLIVNELFTKAEIEKLKKEAKRFNNLKHLPNVICENHGEIRSVFAPHIENEFFDRLYHEERLVKRVEQLIEDQVYLYQYKLNIKKAFTGDKWEWHQDFPYWHLDDGVKSPKMLSVMILLQDTYAIQGPLIVIPESQKQEIVKFQYKKHLDKKQTGKDISMVNSLNADLKYTIKNELLKDLINKKGFVSCEGKIGTCIFFHPNLFHASNSNISPFDRNTAIITYNSINNIPVKKENKRPDYLCSKNFKAI